MLVVASVVLLAGLVNLARLPGILHESVDFSRAERWSRSARADQAAFVLTMLHRQHPASARIAVALAHAQQRSGDIAAMWQTLDELRARNPAAAARATSEFDVGRPQRDARRGGGT